MLAYLTSRHLSPLPLRASAYPVVREKKIVNMSLKWYRMPRIVALGSRTPVLEAARAIENNNIGAVIRRPRALALVLILTAT
jgi:hypothetical protein